MSLWLAWKCCWANIGPRLTSFGVGHVEYFGQWDVSRQHPRSSFQWGCKASPYIPALSPENSVTQGGACPLAWLPKWEDRWSWTESGPATKSCSPSNSTHVTQTRNKGLVLEATKMMEPFLLPKHKLIQKSPVHGKLQSGWYKKTYCKKVGTNGIYVQEDKQTGTRIN